MVEAEVHLGCLRLAAMKQLWRGARPLSLRSHSLALLRYLAERPGQLVMREELLQQGPLLLPPWIERKWLP